jgi:16S rRNA C1402 N4-methylase RsmH
MDEKMLSLTQEKAEEAGVSDRLELIQANFADVAEIDVNQLFGAKNKRRHKNKKRNMFDAMLADFGYNFHQLSNVPGLSYHKSIPSYLDMRYNPDSNDSSVTAEYVLSKSTTNCS